MKHLHLIAFTVGLLILGPNAISQSPEARVPGDPVKIDSGQISGKLVSGNIKAYLGIPYAAPPVGNLRWREPQPVKAWTEVRTADQYGAPCAQRGAARGGGPAYTEDCLFLNVWAPVNPTARKLPVIVYIYGGGYNSGSSSAPFLSGEFLARKGVVYVNFNYRLSVLGSLGLPELNAESPHKASSNYVHMDELAVLQWVHRNIVKFGGDPDNVTLMGQSSGGMDVCYLQASPLTRGLIHRAVALSGSTFPGGPWGARPLKDVERAGVQFQARLGVKSLAELRAVPWERLLENSWIDINEPAAADGYILPEPTPEMFAAHRQTDVPTILEWCRDEGFGGLTNVKTLKEYQAAVQSVAGAKAEEMLRLYPASTDEEARQAALKAGRSGAAAKQMMGWAVAQSAGKSPAFVSVFSYGQTAGHGKDVAYWHGTISQAPAGPGARGAQITAHDTELSEKMTDALIAFAKTGNPSTPAIKWPRFNPKDPHRMDFGDRIEAVPVDKGVFFYIANPDVKVGMNGARGGPGGPGGPVGPQAPGR
ncbi:MAG: carboxylesterase type [Proteobacteria bacterium]|nr:carboxylesterase type [Pseudomonadota bacterium]